MTLEQPTALALLNLHGVEIVDTFAEAFPIKAARLVMTAINERWAKTAATVFCGNATSVIACDVEAAIERDVSAKETPDGRPGVAVLVFGFTTETLATAIQARVGQCVLTCPTTACYNGISDCPKEKRIRIGGGIRYFGDGFQKSKKLGDQRFWRIPVMDGEFLCEDQFGTVTGVAGGNLLICGTNSASALVAAEVAVEAIRSCPDVALPFPGGIVRSGSKVGSRYPKLKASTNDAYCPTLRSLVKSELPVGCQAVYEIVIDGLNFKAVQSAMRHGLHAAAASPGVLRITAGNYGGKLGKHHYHLRDLL
ncbi:MAG: formylmethanofuran--tetrahydromethanopterin N-formyltransferase [Planctomycetales bacterium]|jgi:formylmethanofuran--tetrahydromethanopterin N-formyltransferase|nr:formylmethanofuran--tetrahydromethanopterin N-formyltransferase [Planctomycetales bacterium]